VDRSRSEIADFLESVSTPPGGAGVVPKKALVLAGKPQGGPSHLFVGVKPSGLLWSVIKSDGRLVFKGGPRQDRGKILKVSCARLKTQTKGIFEFL